MKAWNFSILVAVVLVVFCTAYIRLRWRRSPNAYQPMIVLTACYFAAGSMTGAWILHFTGNSRVMAQPVSEPSLASLPSPAATNSGPGTAAPLPALQYDPAHAVLPDARFTPGDTLPGVTAAEVCTPGWASEHRHVTEEMRDRVYEEYGRVQGPACCEVDHLIPLELRGSNEMKNLWPQPTSPRPGERNGLLGKRT